MLSHLYIENYALIEKLDIDFSAGFSAITGETGAGKSIIIGAVSLILGQRADANVLYDKNCKCIIEGNFDISNIELKQFFTENDLDEDNPCVLRREIATNGKSRAFINDTPVNLSQLKELGEKLVDIHSQHNTLTLNNSDFQMSVIDIIAGNLELLKQFRTEYNQYQILKSELSTLKLKQAEANTQKDYLQFLFDELEKAKFEDDEQDFLVKELEIQNNAEEIKSALFKSASILSQSDLNVLTLLNEINSQFLKLKNIHPQINELLTRVQSTIIEIKDIADEIEILEERIQFDPEKISKLSERLDLIYKLQKKHNVLSVSELNLIKNKISDELLLISDYDIKIKDFESELIISYEKLNSIAGSLSERRLKAIPLIELKVKEILNELGMSASVLKIDLKKNQEFSSNGLNSVQFLFNANRGGELRELSKVISGGELSRLMLAIKSIISKQNILPTVIFDEIDNGVSGDIAAKVGNIMRKMAKERQLLVITHLPQIAAKAEQHFFVSKISDSKSTRSNIKQLNSEERIEEIAKMLSNEKITASALETAKELMS